MLHRSSRTSTKSKQNGLIGNKGAVPAKFTWQPGESVKTWSADFKAYCDGITKGFRTALEWAEAFPGVIDSVALASVKWKYLQEANSQLYDFLIAQPEADANAMVLNIKNGCGFEAWRTLATWFDNYGRVSELDRLNRLMAMPRCRPTARAAS